MNEYLAIDSGGHVSDLVLARNCCLTRFNNIATQGAPQMAVDKKANSLRRVYSYYSKFNLWKNASRRSRVGVGMNRSAREGKSVKRFERSNGPDIALYKNYLFTFTRQQ